MISIKRTDSSNSDFEKLAHELDVSLALYYKEETSFYEQLNNIEKIQHTIVAYDETGNAVGCGGIKKFSQKEVELKRMYVLPTQRGKGIASTILTELEKWSLELQFEKCILETLKEKTYAIKFYQKHNYKIIPNFGAYVNAINSICFEKSL